MKKIFPDFDFVPTQYSVKTRIRFFEPNTLPPEGVEVLVYYVDDAGCFVTTKAFWIKDEGWVHPHLSIDTLYADGKNYLPACWTFIPRPPEKFDPHEIQRKKSARHH